MRTLQRVGAGILALTLAGGITACGDDDDEGTTDTTAASSPAKGGGASAAFCDGLVEFNAAASSSDAGNPDAAEADIVAAGEQLEPLSQALVDEAPDDLAAQAEEIHAVVEPLLEGDAGAFSADSTFETYLGFLESATDACDFPSVEVEGRDYAFDAPETIAAGTTAFTFTNVSDAEPHEMLVMRKLPGTTLTFEEIFNLPEEEGETMSEFVTATFAEPGEEGSALVTMEPGEYAMVCFIPVGGGEDGPPHFTQGMLHEFTVE